MSLKPPTKFQQTQEGPASYTPVIFPDDSNKAFESSLPSLSSISGLPSNLTYLEELSRKHKALVQIVREEPPSPPRYESQNEDYDEEAFLSAREERIADLRDRVRDAWVKAEGNPADGKWIFLTNLLRMGVASGRSGRWAGARTDRKPPEQLDGPGLGWINAKTEAEWREWEKRYQEERRVKDKVENWKKRVQPPSNGPSLHRSFAGRSDGSLAAAAPAQKLPASTGSSAQTKDAEARAKVSLKAAGSTTSASKPTANALTSAALADPLKDAAPFGFGVVKRLSQKNSAGGKPSGSGKPANSANKDQAELDDAHVAPQGPGAGEPSKKASNEPSKSKPPVIPASSRDMNVRSIADLPDLSFPPSFPSSQMITSTPNAAAKPLSNSKARQTDSPQAPSTSTAMPSLSSLLLPLPSDLPNPPVSKPNSAAQHQPPSSPGVTKTYGRHNPGSSPLETSASLPAIPFPTPSTPTRKNVRSDNDDGNKNANNKRVFPSSSPPTFDNANNANGQEERAVKKARTLPSFDLLSPTMPPSKNRAAPQQILTAYPFATRPRSPRTPNAHAHGSRVPAPSGFDAVGLGGGSAAGPSAGAGGVLPMSSSSLGPPPSTPLAKAAENRKQKSALPTLTELLASAKKGKKSAKPSSKGKATAKAPDSKGSNAEEQAEAEKAAILQLTPPIAFLPAAVVHTDAYGDVIPDHEAADAYIFDPYAVDPHFDVDLALDRDVDVDVSPTKSLSSIAGSDSEDELEHDELEHDHEHEREHHVSSMGFSFKPFATSTQHGPFGGGNTDTNDNPDISMNNDSGAAAEVSQATKDSWASVYAPGSSAGGGGGVAPPPSSSFPAPHSSANFYAYNSQFESEVAKQVDRVDKLLEKELDYEGWLKDPSEEGEGAGAGVEESP